MITINKTQQEVHILVNKRLRKLKGDYNQIYDVVQKKFSKIDSELLPHYINYMRCREAVPGENVIIYSLLHEKIFSIYSELIEELTIDTIIGWLFCINDHFYQGIQATAKCEVYDKASFHNLSMIFIRTKEELIKNSFVITSKQIKDYWRSIAICSLRPIYTNLLEGVETIEAMGFGIDIDEKISQKKSISESLERMMSGIFQSRATSCEPLHTEIAKLYMGDEGLRTLEYTKENLFMSESILTGKPYGLPGNILYYPYSGNDFWNGNSNGVGCHISQEKAIENGLFELIERDAFMVFRLTKSHGEKIYPSDKVQKRINEQTYGKYESHLFLLHYDHPLPVVLTVIKRDKSIVCSMGVGYTLDEAIQKSLNESGQFAVDHLNYSTEEKDDDLIVERHIKHYLKSENFSDVSRFFELDGVDYATLQEKSRTTDYEALLNYFQKKGNDVIIHQYNHQILDVMKRKCVRVVSDYLIPIRFGGVDKEWIYTSNRIVEAKQSTSVNKVIHPFG